MFAPYEMRQRILAILAYGE